MAAGLQGVVSLGAVVFQTSGDVGDVLAGEVTVSGCLGADALGLALEVGLASWIRLISRPLQRTVCTLDVLGIRLFDLHGTTVEHHAQWVLRRAHLVLDVLLEVAVHPVVDGHLLLDVVDALALARDHGLHLVRVGLEHLQLLGGAVQIFLEKRAVVASSPVRLQAGDALVHVAHQATAQPVAALGLDHVDRADRLGKVLASSLDRLGYRGDGPSCGAGAGVSTATQDAKA